MRKYLKERKPIRGTDPINIISLLLEKVGKTPWLLLGLLIIITIFSIIQVSITGFSIENIPEYNEEPLWSHMIVVSISIIGLIILNKYTNKRKTNSKKYK